MYIHYIYVHTQYIYIYTHTHTYICIYIKPLCFFTICKLTQEEMIKQNAEKWIL